MLPPDWWCTGCGRQLNEGGRRPAELYAGTFTGLCTGCMGKGPWVTEISVLDGARRVSWPPHCPSWRRDREVHIAYEDCGTCAGLGLETPAYRSWSGGGQYCRPCISRYSSHALRVWDLMGIRQVTASRNQGIGSSVSRLPDLPARSMPVWD